ncbi:hypothetical protein JHK87_049977 [Glycine soja]|nr:hypothetical protein JHK87_049977 [Glycine soja]
MYFILSADALVSTGLADLGYGYVNIGTVPYFDQQDQILLNGSFDNVANNVSVEIASFGNLTQPIAGRNKVPYKISESVTLQTMDNQANPHEQKNNTVSLSGVDSLDSLVNDRLQSQNSFGMWVVVTGFFLKDYMHLSNSNLLCVCGDVSVPAEIVQVWMDSSSLGNILWKGESGCNSIVCWGEAKFGPQNPDECTTTDLAYMRGHDGLEAYLSEKSLVQHFNGWKYQWLTGN